MNGEYAGFFDIGMVQRNEANAIIVHGTMCLIRRTAIDGAGSWSSRTIVEDTDLGLTLLEQGWQVHYTNRRYGHGLLPDTFEAYKKQRHRWAYGGFQILRNHWRYLLPRARGLTRDQKREYALGWLNWLGAETLGVVVAILNLLWVPVIVFLDIAIPDKILTIPILAAFAVSLLHFVALYRLRVSIPLAQMVGAGRRRHVGAMDGGARRRLRHLEGKHALHAHRQGRRDRPRARLRGVLGSRAGGAAAGQRDAGGHDQLQADHRAQYLRRRAGGAEPAVHRGGGDRGARRLALQRIRLLARRRGQGRRDPAPSRPLPPKRRRRCPPRTASKPRSNDKP